LIQMMCSIVAVLFSKAKETFGPRLVERMVPLSEHWSMLAPAKENCAPADAAVEADADSGAIVVGASDEGADAPRTFAACCVLREIPATTPATASPAAIFTPITHGDRLRLGGL